MNIRNESILRPAHPGLLAWYWAAARHPHCVHESKMQIRIFADRLVQGALQETLGQEVPRPVGEWLVRRGKTMESHPPPRPKPRARASPQP